MRLLGIDYGEKRVGVAITDDKGMMAFPHSVVENSKDLLGRIADLARENNVTIVILGESRNYKGEANRIMERIEGFAKSLRESGFEVVYEPEMLSSHQAAHFQGKTDKLDASAASIILQSYIDRTMEEQGNRK